MDPLPSALFLIVGVGLLLGGAELFTESAIDTARALRVTTLAIGLLLAGAEPEELVTAAIAAGRGSPGIAIGDAVGTNVTIIGLALATGALLMPISADPRFVRHGLITLIASVPATVLLLAGQIGRLAGLVLCALYGLYVWYVVRRERLPLETEEGTLEELAEELAEPPKKPVVLSLGLTLLGLAMMGAGGHFTVDAARAIAIWADLTETAVGLTLVALATSLEMVVLAIVPVLKGHPELTIGGILGSYAYNMTLTLGVAAVVAPLSLAADSLRLPIFFMIQLLLMLLFLLRRQPSLGRGSGALLMASYLLFVGLALRA